MNSFGNIFRLTDFGESHGTAIGGVIDGMPAGVEVDLDFIQKQLDRRRPGQSDIVTARKESDTVKILSGVFEGKTTGTPIGFIIENENHHSADYSEIAKAYRPSHADYTYDCKYGFRDYRGGGRSSARETAVRVVGGAFALLALKKLGINIYAYTSKIGTIGLDEDKMNYSTEEIESNSVRCPNAEKADAMYRLVKEIKAQGDSIGGVVTCVIKGVPAGLGEPVFDKYNARLAYAMMGINAAKGFEIGMGFDSAEKRGTETIDHFYNDNGTVATRSNNSGGIQGGISNGMDIYFRVAFKPVATLLKDVETIDKSHNDTILKARGRHDPCVVPRAVPVVEAMAAMVTFDLLLQNRCSKL